MQKDADMRICIPTIDNKEHLSEVCNHFGSAPYFIIYDSEANTYETVNNSDSEHEHGTCRPTLNISAMNVDTVICKGLGRRAIQKLNEAGIRVCKTDLSHVKEIVYNLAETELEEIDASDACTGHGCH